MITMGGRRSGGSARAMMSAQNERPRSSTTAFAPPASRIAARMKSERLCRCATLGRAEARLLSRDASLSVVRVQVTPGRSGIVWPGVGKASPCTGMRRARASSRLRE